MGIKKVFGWLLLIVGIIIMIFPFVHGLTGFFITSLAVSIPQPRIDLNLQFPYLIIGIILAVIGWVLAKPKSEGILDKLGK